MSDEELLYILLNSYVPSGWVIITYAVIILFLFIFPYWLVRRWEE